MQKTQDRRCFGPRLFRRVASLGQRALSLGRAYEEHHYFLDAQKKYEKAIALKELQGQDNLAELIWDYGVLLAEIAKVSEEALDLHLAVQAFQRALTYPYFFDATFWSDYGNAQLNLAEQINDTSLFVKAVHCFKQAVSATSGDSVSWMNLATAWGCSMIERMIKTILPKQMSATASLPRCAPTIPTSGSSGPISCSGRRQIGPRPQAAGAPASKNATAPTPATRSCRS